MRIDRGCLFAASLVLCGALICAKAESSSGHHSASNASSGYRVSGFSSDHISSAYPSSDYPSGNFPNLLRVASNDASRVGSSVDAILDSDASGFGAESSKIDSGNADSAKIAPLTESKSTESKSTKSTILINSARVKKHAFTLGLGFFGGDRIVDYKKSDIPIPDSISLPNKLRATDSSILAMIGGIYRMTKRNTLRYMFNLGYSNICLYGEGESENLDRIHGLKYGAKLVWEWSFYRGEVVSWNTVLGAEYANAYYKKDSTNMFIGEISPQVGVGLEIRYRHYIEYIIAMPLFSKLKIESNQESFYIPQRFEHIRAGINYMYRF